MEDKVEQYTLLDPWIYGPYELIQHAEEHLKANGDFDRRMALISYDNAIELTITTFLQLHPSQRNGLEYPKSEIEKWLANYHTKLDFFEMYVKSTNQKVKITKPNIIWSHKHRNELYHDGKGMIPEERVLKAIRAAALYVFSTLFNIDAEELLKDPPILNGTQKTEDAVRVVATGKLSLNGKGSDTRIVKLKSGVAIFRLKYQGEDIPTFYLNNEDDRVISRLNATNFSVLTVPTTGRQKTVKIKIDGVYLLKVRASGSWEVEIEQ